jgi:arylsulfatase A
MNNKYSTGLVLALIFCLTVSFAAGSNLLDFSVLAGNWLDCTDPADPVNCDAEPPATPDTRPNIIFILADDLGYGDIGCFGHPMIESPRIDSLATDGIRLTDCYVSAPMCSPTRASILTGRAHYRTGMYDWLPFREDAGLYMHLPLQEVTIAELLKDAGYTTAHMGKWHLGEIGENATQPQPDEHGYDYWFASQLNEPYRNPTDFHRNGVAVGQIMGYSYQVVTNEAIDWLTNTRDPSKPFFQYIAYHEVHEGPTNPLPAPQHLIDKYTAKGASTNEAIYYGAVNAIDDGVGQILDTLDTLGLADNTIVVFTSDHGPRKWDSGTYARSYGSAGPYYGWKRYTFDGGMRVPYVMRWPNGIPSGLTSGEPVHLEDMLPTFCKMAGVDVPQDRPIDGSDISPLFASQPVARHRPLFWVWHDPTEGPQAWMRQGQWIVTAQFDIGDFASGRFQKTFQTGIRTAGLTNFKLYDIVNDPGQTSNVSASHPTLFADMSAQLTDIYDEVQADTPWWE